MQTIKEVRFCGFIGSSLGQANGCAPIYIHPDLDGRRHVDSRLRRIDELEASFRHDNVASLEVVSDFDQRPNGIGEIRDVQPQTPERYLRRRCPKRLSSYYFVSIRSLAFECECSIPVGLDIGIA